MPRPISISTTTRIVIEDPALIRDVYTGKPGCCCGCNGNYSTGDKAVRAHLSRTNRLFADGEITAIDVTPDCGVFVETATRYRNIYVCKGEAIITQCGDLIVITKRTTGSAFITRAVAEHAAA